MGIGIPLCFLKQTREQLQLEQVNMSLKVFLYNFVRERERKRVWLWVRLTKEQDMRDTCTLKGLHCRLHTFEDPFFHTHGQGAARDSLLLGRNQFSLCFLFFFFFFFSSLPLFFLLWSAPFYLIPHIIRRYTLSFFFPSLKDNALFTYLPPTATPVFFPETSLNH